jgi:leucyl aminopeptidase
VGRKVAGGGRGLGAEVKRHLVGGAGGGAIPIRVLDPAGLAGWLGRASAQERRWLAAAGFAAQPEQRVLVPDRDGGLVRVVAGALATGELETWASLGQRLPQALYRIDPEPGDAAHAEQVALGWVLGSYGFDRYRRTTRQGPALVWPRLAPRSRVGLAAGATRLVRDLINTPAADLGPAELVAATRRVGRLHGARVSVVSGDELRRDYPAVHAVGRAASPARAPRLIDLRWGRRGPEVTLVGKGVCFDSGGLDIKSASGMLLMKKDMGGAAHALGLAAMVMGSHLPVRLRLLIPAVENAVSGDALRPLDVIRTRKGLSVEVGNTDAEGRLILADALAAAGRPDLLIDFATLTGAARVALGPELPALFCNDDALARQLEAAAAREADPVWRLPLHPPYRRLLESSVADLSNVSGGPFAGALTAALFLEHFVVEGVPWVHLDVMAWNALSRPGRPEGGEAMGLRAVYALLEERARLQGAAG